MADDCEQLMERCMSLRLHCEQLVRAIEAATSERQQALAHVPRLRRLLRHSMRRAEGRQHKALMLGQQLHALSGRVVALREEMEYIERHGGDVTIIRGDLRAIEQIIESYAVVPDLSQQTADDGDSAI